MSLLKQDESAKNWYFRLLFLGIGFFLLLFLWSWNWDLLKDNEAAIGLPIRSMIEGGNWFLPRVDGELYLTSPPLSLWFGGGLAYIFQSSSPLILRLPTMISAVLLIVSIAWFTSRHVDESTGLIAAVVTGTSWFFLWKSMLVTGFLPGVLLIVLSSYLFFNTVQPSQVGSWQGYAGFLCLGLGVLTTGTPGFIPVLLIFLVPLVSKEEVRLSALPWGTGSVLFLSILAIWVVPSIYLHDPNFVLRVVAHHTIGSIQVAWSENPSFSSEFGLVFVKFLPWTPFLIVGGFRSLWSDGDRSGTDWYRFHLLFGTVAIIVMGFLVPKGNYDLHTGMLLFLPSAGVVTAIYLHDQILFSEERSRLHFVGSAFLGLFLLLLAGLAFYVGEKELLQAVHIRPLPISGHLIAGITGSVFLLSGLFILLASFLFKPNWVFFGLVFHMGLLVLFGKLILLPMFNPQENVIVEPPSGEGIQNVFLTWEKEDIVHTMTINFQTHTGQDHCRVAYDTESGDGNPQSYSFSKKADSRSVSSLNRTVHHVTLDGLTPDTSYYFVVDCETTQSSSEKQFRTLPDGDDKPVRFLVGGDHGVKEKYRTLNKWAAKKDPHFAMIGGDMAYANGKLTGSVRWESWFRGWNPIFSKETGRLVPAIFALGNHDVNDHLMDDASLSKYDKAPFYFYYFQQGEQSGHFGKRLGDLLYILVLDSGYFHNSKEQVSWIREKLTENGDVTFSSALYHRPLYPAKASDEDYKPNHRDVWGPIFDEFQIEVAFEHDGHFLKRSHFLKGNKKVKEDGVLYIGNGGWGRCAREPNKDLWYIDKAAQTCHFWYGELTEDRMKLQAIDLEGNVVDEVTITPRSGRDDE